MAAVRTAKRKRKKTKTLMRTEKIFNESGKGYWMEGFVCLRAEGENRPSRPGHVVCYAIEGNVVDRVSAKNGKGWCEDVSPTLNTQDRHAICFAWANSPSSELSDSEHVTPTIKATRCGEPAVCIALEGVCYDARGYGEGDVAPAMTGDHNRRVSDYSALVVVTKENKEMMAYSAGNGQLHQVQLTDVSDTLDCMHDQKMVLMEGNEMRPERKYVLRRLTPTECLRLQGLPDWWCDGANGSDTAIYKMAGNGLAIPCAADVLGRIAEAMEDGE